MTQMNNLLNGFNLSYSSLNQFHSCPMRFMLSKFSDCDNPRTSSTATLIGTAVHEAFQYYLITNDLIGAEKVLILKYPTKLKKAMSGNYHFLTAHKILHALVDWYKNSGYELLIINDKPAVEFKVETEYNIKYHSVFPDLPYLDPRLQRFKYIGYIDCIFFNPTDGSIIICDIKTSSTTKSNEEEEIKYALSPQTVEYVTNFMLLLGYSMEEINQSIHSITVLYLIARFNGLDYEINPLELLKTKEDMFNLDNGLSDLITLLNKNQDNFSNYYKSGNCQTFGNTCPFFQQCSTNCYPKFESNEKITQSKISVNPKANPSKQTFNTKMIVKEITI